MNLTLSKDGAAVLHSLTKKAAQAGNSARLVVKAGQKLLAATEVMNVIVGNNVQIILRPGESAKNAAELIREG